MEWAFGQTEIHIQTAVPAAECGTRLISDVYQMPDPLAIPPTLSRLSRSDSTERQNESGAEGISGAKTKLRRRVFNPCAKTN